MKSVDVRNRTPAKDPGHRLLVTPTITSSSLIPVLAQRMLDREAQAFPTSVLSLIPQCETFLATTTPPTWTTSRMAVIATAEILTPRGTLATEVVPMAWMDRLTPRLDQHTMTMII
jgi:hypothetical protein